MSARVGGVGGWSPLIELVGARRPGATAARPQPGEHGPKVGPTPGLRSSEVAVYRTLELSLPPPEYGPLSRGYAAYAAEAARSGHPPEPAPVILIDTAV